MITGLSLTPLAIAIAVLVVAIFATAIPFVPAGGVSMAGVGYYWHATGEPGTVVLVALLSLGVVTVLLDWLGGALSARAGGASLRTTAIAAVVALPLLFVFGPLGVLLGVAAGVFALEYRRHGDVERGLRTAGYATVGLLASTAMQAFLTSMVLVGFLLAVL
ncbi:MAG: hypothetical protein ACI8UR_002059 [Natronomonas sp.]|jgi:uncharacterized protein YqgC (DUF456 family)|uniref:DUF456 domain-containing protein n=1 Tax=Natronomonas sp. TaxID=2184060 RepID=UPI0039891BC8